MSLFAGASRYFHTLRHLKPVQFYGRVTFRVRRPAVDASPGPALTRATAPWVTPARRTPSLVGPTTFEYLGARANLDDIGWDDPQQEKLWRYNQHYFDDLNAAAAAERAHWHLALIEHWVAHNPPGVGTAWEPYPTSLRIVNWVKWLRDGNALPEAAVHSLAVQTRWLTGRLEHHLLGNHLFANAKALVFAGLAFEGQEADKWLALGLRLIARELPEQVLPDGGNFERSPMYHAIFLEDVLDLLNVTCACPGRSGASQLDHWRNVAGRMLDWLRGMSHPDGGISLFNDAAFDIAPGTGELAQYAARLGIPSMPPTEEAWPSRRAWRDSGYVRLEAKHAVALLDVAPIGPDYLPGHAHADTLSFELSLFGQRMVVNGGTSRYGLGPERMRERATCSHSTVEIDGVSSSEVWSGFRVARRAYPFDLTESVGPEAVSIACSHDGYRRLPGKPVHRRTWTMRNGRLDIADVVQGTYRSAKARYIIHPDVSVARRSERVWELTTPGGQCALFEIANGEGRLEQANYAPVFGSVRKTVCIVIELNDNVANISMKWS